MSAVNAGDIRWTHLAYERYHVARYVPSCKTGARIREKVSPFSLESLVRHEILL